MKKIALLLLVFFTTVLSWSQTPNWSWAYNYEAFNSGSRGLTATSSNGDVYLIGNFQSPSITVGTTTLTNIGSTNTGDIYILKYNSSGTLLWVKKEGGLSMDMITSIATDNAGNFYLLGSFGNQITIGATTLTNGSAPFLAKYNASGDVQWVKKIGVLNEICVPNKIKVDAVGNIYMTGYYRSATVTFDTFVLTDATYDPNVGGNSFIVKYATDGNALWAKGTQRTGSTVFTNISYDLAFDSGGNVFIGGVFFSSTMQFDSVTLNNSSGSNTIFMAKYNMNGNVLWAKTPVASSPNNYITAVTTDTSGNVFFSGTFSGSMTFDTSTVTASSSGNKLFTVKYDSSGVAQWARTATNTGGSSYSNIDSSDVDSLGNLYVIGTFSPTTINFGNGITATNSDTGGLFVVKYNSSGTPLWIRTANSLNINSRLSIDCKNENEIYIAGYFNNPSTLTFGGITLTKKNPTTNGYDIFIAKLNYTLSSPIFTEDSFQAAPNPVEDWLFFSPIDGKYSYSLVDSIGKKITSGELTPENNSISFEALAEGLYFIEIQNTQGEKIIKRIIKK